MSKSEAVSRKRPGELAQSSYRAAKLRRALSGTDSRPSSAASGQDAQSELSGLDGVASVAGSSVSGSSSACGSAVGKLSSQPLKYMVLLSPGACLNGDKVEGQSITFWMNQAERKRVALTRDEPASSELVQLTARIKMMQQAQLLAPGKFHSLADPQRTELLDALCPNLSAGTDYRPNFALNLLLCKTKELRSGSLMEWLDVVTPFGEGSLCSAIRLDSNAENSLDDSCGSFSESLSSAF